MDFKDKSDLSAEGVLQLARLFTVYVMDSAIKSGRWPVIGHVTLPDVWLRPLKFFRQDRLHPERVSIALSDGTEIPSDMKGVEGMEKSAVWSAEHVEHVENRIIDHFAGRPNASVKSLGLRR